MTKYRYSLINDFCVEHYKKGQKRNIYIQKLILVIKKHLKIKSKEGILFYRIVLQTI